jgi:hypothetical protein
MCGNEGRICHVELLLNDAQLFLSMFLDVMQLLIFAVIRHLFLRIPRKVSVVSVAVMLFGLLETNKDFYETQKWMLLVDKLALPTAASLAVVPLRTHP